MSVFSYVAEFKGYINKIFPNNYIWLKCEFSKNLFLMETLIESGISWQPVGTPFKNFLHLYSFLMKAFQINVPYIYVGGAGLLLLCETRCTVKQTI